MAKFIPPLRLGEIGLRRGSNVGGSSNNKKKIERHRRPWEKLLVQKAREMVRGRSNTR